MDKKLFFTLVVSLLLGFLFYQLFLVFEPFLNSLIWAGILVVVFYPLYKKVLSKVKNPELASFIMCGGMTLVILLPMSVLLVILFDDLAESAVKLSHTVQNFEYNKLIEHPLLKHPLVTAAYEQLNQYVDLSKMDFKTPAIKSVQGLSQFVLSKSKDFFQVFSGIFILIGLIEINMFFLFRDGKRFLEYVKDLIPVASEYKKVVLARMKEVILASIFGTVVTACAQGFLGGVAFFFLGVPSAILWGVIMALMSFLPLAGPFVVWGPVAVYLFFIGSPIKALILVAWGTLVVGTIDNLLRPLLMNQVSSESSRLNTLVLFLSVLGGLKVFGFLGIVLAPLLIVVTLTLLEILHLTLGEEEADLMLGDQLKSAIQENAQEA